MIGAILCAAFLVFLVVMYVYGRRNPLPPKSEATLDGIVSMERDDR